ncbi:hypothetical protein IFM89_015694 [Coptis chinensis]|uniref:F-box protein n=1 Tax=Coptis chinensis TaxID=261450 RepID=A0A835M845_9MAGN|nr:hypothetical protein IFM89_015694 [Coptis chinensis]
MSNLLKQKYSCQPPSWEIIHLVSEYLDPKALANTSCVNKTWSILMSSDHLWKSHCFAHYPSLFNLHVMHPTVSYRKLYILGHLSPMCKHVRPQKPYISMNDIFFTIDVLDGDSHIFSLTKAGEDIMPDSSGLFRFDLDVHASGISMTFKLLDELRVKWSVVLKDWKGVALVMDSLDCKERGKKGTISGSERWFMEELPLKGCCFSLGASNIVSELRLFSLSKDRNKMMKVEKVTVGLLRENCWRYLSVDDALRYLQRFLLPSLA